MPAPDLRINGGHLKTLEINDVCRYLGHWGTGNGDMSTTREVVRESESGKWHNQQPPADTRTFCRTLRTERNRGLPVLYSPY